MKTLTALTCLLVLPAVSSAELTLRQTIEKSLKPTEQALLKKDLDAFEKIVGATVSKDFKYSEEGGQPMGFGDMVKGMRMGMGMYKKVKVAKATLVKVTEKGDTGTAIEKHVMAGTSVGPDGKTVEMAYEGTSFETYRKVKGKWLLTSMKMKADKMTVDGKPFPGMGGKN